MLNCFISCDYAQESLTEKSYPGKIVSFDGNKCTVELLSGKVVRVNSLCVYREPSLRKKISARVLYAKFFTGKLSKHQIEARLRKTARTRTTTSYRVLYTWASAPSERRVKRFAAKKDAVSFYSKIAGEAKSATIRVQSPSEGDFPWLSCVQSN